MKLIFLFNAATQQWYDNFNNTIFKDPFHLSILEPFRTFRKYLVAKRFTERDFIQKVEKVQSGIFDFFDMTIKKMH